MPPPLPADDLAEQLHGQLVDEVAVLEALILAISRGEPTESSFQALHDASTRDGRVEALAAAYERVRRESRLRRMEREHQAILLTQAATFYADVPQNFQLAFACLERSLAADPTNADTLALADRLLVPIGDPMRVVEVYGAATSARSDPAGQLYLWRRCLDVVEAMPDSSEAALAVRERLVKLEPSDATIRAELARDYAALGRHRELVKLLEQVLPHLDPADDEWLNTRLRLLVLYRDTLREPQRAMPHIEQLLQTNPVNETALEAAESLMESRLLAPRLAPLLANAYARLRRPHDEVSVLSRELKLARPPRLAEVQRRLALLRLDVLDDIDGALELLGPLVSSNPGDDEARRRYLEMSARAERSADAARLLSRVVHYPKDEGAKARVGYDLGALYMALGDNAAAQGAFEQVAKLGGQEDAVLASARKLIELLGPSGDPKKLARALEVVARLDPDQKRKHQAAKRLAELSDKFKLDPAYAMVAWRALVDSPEGAEALAKLQDLCEAAKDEKGLAEVLDLRARRTKDPDEARVLAVRSAELKAKSKDPTAALEAFRNVLTRFGPSREIYARLSELLERGSQWEELVSILEADAASAPAPERGSILAKAARIRLERLGDAAGALGVFRQSLELNPAEPTSRAALERLLRQSKVRLEAGEILEPLFRAEKKWDRLLELLELRATMAGHLLERLTFLEEAVELAEKQLKDPVKAIELCRSALHAAAATDRRMLPAWLERLQRFAQGRSDRIAEILLEVLGEGDRLEPELADFAVAAAEALVAAGNYGRARALLERALAEDPTSPELLGRIDSIAARDSTPKDRIARYQRAIGAVQAPGRWRQLMQAVARIQRQELGSPTGAAATLQQIASRYPDDWATHLALLEVYEALGDDAAIDAELERSLLCFGGAERQLTLVSMIDRLERRGEEQRALELCGTLLEETTLAEAALEAAERIFERAGDFENLRRVLERRVNAATEPHKRADAMERLGNFFLEQLGDPSGAAELWRAGARLCGEMPEDVERARRLFERVLDAFPSDQEAAGRLVELYAASGQWSKVPEVYAVCVRGETSPEKQVEVLLTLAPRAASAGASDEFIALADEALWKVSGKLSRKIIAAKAVVLAATPTRQAEAGQTFRHLVDTYGEEEDIRSFLEFIEQTADENERRESLRWLFQWRVGRATDPLPLLFEWAAVEHDRLKDAEGAIGVYERIVARDPQNRMALQALVRLELQIGKVEEALTALESLRIASTKEEQPAVDVRMARLVIDRLGNPSRALEYLARALEGAGTSEEILELARNVLTDPEARARAAELLERASASTERADAVRVMHLLLEATEHATELRETRRRWCERLLDLVSGDDEASFSVALRAASEFPEWEDFWAKSEALGKKTGDQTSVGAAYRRALSQPMEAEAAERVGARAADYFEQVLGDPAEMVAALQRVLEHAPKARWALDRIKLTLTLQRRYEELLELYDRAVQAQAEPSVRAELLDEAVVVAKDLANDPNLAMRYLEQLHELRPTDARIEATLERLYERQGLTRKLIDLLQKKTEGLSESERRSMRARIAGLWVELAEPRQALPLIEPLLRSADHKGNACELLERILRLPRVAEEEQNELLRAAQRRTAELLKGEYTRENRVGDVVRLTEVELDLIEDPQERIARLKQIVSLRLETLDDAAGAFDALCVLIRLEPEVSAHRVRAAALASRLGRQDRLAEVLVGAAGESDPPRAALMLEAARLYAEALGEPERAIELYKDVLSRGHRDPEAARDAGQALERLLAAERKSSERLAVLEQLATLVGAGEEKNAMLSEAARVAFEEVKDADRAARNWRAILEYAPGHETALTGLIQALRAAGRPRELADALSARARVTADPQAARRDRVRVAHLYAEELGEPATAAAVWKAIRADLGSDVQSFEALSQLYETQVQWGNLVELISEEARAERQPERRRQLLVRLAKVQSTHTSDITGAVQSYALADEWAQAVQAADSVRGDERRAMPTFRVLLREANEAWRRTGNATDSPPAQASLWSLRALVRKLVEIGDRERALDLCLEGARLPFEGKQKRILKRNAAWIAAGELGRAERAVELLRELFAEDEGDDVAVGAATRYAELLESVGLHSERAELWEGQAERAAQIGDAPSASDLWVRAADLWETKAGDADRAILTYSKAADLGSEAAFEALARLYGMRGDGRRSAEALDGLFQRTATEARVPQGIRVADAYLAIGERAVARARLEEVLPLGGSGNNVAAVRVRLAEIYRVDAAWEPLAALLDAEAEETPDEARRVALLREVARLYADRLGDPAAGVERLRKAIEIRPDDGELGSELAQLLSATGQFDDAAELLQRRIDAYEGRRPKERAPLHGKLADVLLAAGRRDEALKQLETAAQIDPTRSDILYQLARFAQEQGRLPDAEQTYRTLLLALRRPAAQSEQAPTLAEVYLGLSEVARQRGDAPSAADLVESAFEAAVGDAREAIGLERALRSMNRDDLLMRAVQARLDQSSDPAQVADALAELVEMHADKPVEDAGLRSRIRARAESLRTALLALPHGDARAFRALSSVFTWLGEDAANAGIVEHWVRALQADANADAEHLYELSGVCLTIPSLRDAGAGLLERALALQPEADRALELLRPAVEGDTPDVRAVRLFEKVCRGPGREALRAHALARVAALPDAQPADVRTAAEHALAVGDRALAQSILNAGASREGGSFGAADRAWMLARLATLAEQDGRLAEAAELGESAAAAAPDSKQSPDLLRHAATLWASKLGKHDRAFGIFAALIERTPSDGTLWQAALEAHQKVARAGELIELIDANAGKIASQDLRNDLLLRQAKLLLSAHRTEEALTVLKRIVDADPRRLEAADLRAQVLEQTGKVDELADALGARLRGARAAGDTAAMLALSLRLGGLLERGGRGEEALEAYREALRTEPAHADALRSLIRLSASHPVGSEELAAALEELLNFEEGTAAAEAALRLATIYADQWNDSAAERALLKGFACDPSNEGILQELVARYTERGQWAKLSEVLERALEAVPGDRAIALRLSESSRRAGQFDRAVEVLDLVDRGNDPELAHQRFVVLRGARRTEEALEALEQSARLDPHHIDELAGEIERASAELDPQGLDPRILGLVELVERSGEAARARDLLRRLSQGNPPPQKALTKLAKLEAAAKNWPEAMSTYRRLLALDLGDEIEPLALALADACEKADRAADARADLERALENAPRSAKLRARLRGLYEKLGARDQLARTYLSEATEHADPLARMGALVNAGALMLEAGNGSQAIGVLERAHEQEPAHVEAALLLAKAYRSSGRPEQALTVLTQTASRHDRTRTKEVARLHSQIADLHLASDDLVEAFGSLKLAFDLDKANASLALLLGLVAVDLDEHKAAQTALQAVTVARSGSDVTPEYRSVAYYHLGRMAQVTGDGTRARLWAAKAVREDPNNGQAKTFLEEFGGD